MFNFFKKRFFESRRGNKQSSVIVMEHTIFKAVKSLIASAQIFGSDVRIPRSVYCLDVCSLQLPVPDMCIMTITILLSLSNEAYDL